MTLRSDRSSSTSKRLLIAPLIAAALVFASQNLASGEQQSRPVAGNDGGERYVQIVVGEIEEVIWKPEDNLEIRSQIRQELQHLIDYLESDSDSHDRLWSALLQRKLDRKRRELVQFNLGSGPINIFPGAIG
jgi:hypothetical protein